MEFRIYLLIICAVVSSVYGTTRVIELSDRFLELRGDSAWVILFYAPWCGHCRKLEPVWNHIAQALYGTDIRVGKVDCTRFTAMGSEFVVKGYPTIMYVEGELRHTYKGDRGRDEIVGYAIRMSSPTVPHIPDYSNFKNKQKDNSLFFTYIGDKQGPLWESYFSIAKEFQQHHFFYSITEESFLEHSDLEYNPAVIVVKDDSHYFYPVPDLEGDIDQNVTTLNESLGHWVNHERFSIFIRLTQGNLPQLWKLKKFLVITVVEETKVGTITADETIFRDMVQSVIINKREKFHSHFQFGWTGSPDIVNGLVMDKMPLPSLIVVNATTLHHHFPEDPPHLLTPAAIELFLQSVMNDTAPAYGGDSTFIRIYRMMYNAKTGLDEMWSGNPVLTAVLFGLPMGFLSLICYSIWCSDIMDAEDEEDEHHEKKE